MGRKRKYGPDDGAYKHKDSKRKRKRRAAQGTQGGVAAAYTATEAAAAAGLREEDLPQHHPAWGTLSVVPFTAVSTPEDFKDHCEEQLAAKWAGKSKTSRSWAQAKNRAKDKFSKGWYQWAISMGGQWGAPYTAAA